MTARIYRPAKTAMQSGRGKTHRWVLDYDAESARSVEPLMGWTSSADTKSQLRMYFATKDDAVAFAKREGVAYQVVEPKERAAKSHSYSDNFRFNRVGTWTH